MPHSQSAPGSAARRWPRLRSLADSDAENEPPETLAVWDQVMAPRYNAAKFTAAGKAAQQANDAALARADPRWARRLSSSARIGCDVNVYPSVIGRNLTRSGIDTTPTSSMMQMMSAENCELPRKKDARRCGTWKRSASWACGSTCWQ